MGHEGRCFLGLRINLNHMGFSNVHRYRIAHKYFLCFASIETHGHCGRDRIPVLLIRAADVLPLLSPRLKPRASGRLTMSSLISRYKALQSTRRSRVMLSTLFSEATQIFSPYLCLLLYCPLVRRPDLASNRSS